MQYEYDRSKLFAFKGLIVEMRRGNYPYEKIAEHIAEKHGVVASKQAVFNFCKKHRIQKGSVIEREKLETRKPHQAAYIHSEIGAVTPPEQSPEEEVTPLKKKKKRLGIFDI